MSSSSLQALVLAASEEIDSGSVALYREGDHVQPVGDGERAGLRDVALNAKEVTYPSTDGGFASGNGRLLPGRRMLYLASACVSALLLTLCIADFAYERPQWDRNFRDIRVRRIIETGKGIHGQIDVLKSQADAIDTRIHRLNNELTDVRYSLSRYDAQPIVNRITLLQEDREHLLAESEVLQKRLKQLSAEMRGLLAQ